MALRPRLSRRNQPARADGRFSLCLTRVALVDRHPRKRPPVRYGAMFTGMTLVASILVALAVWPRESVTFPGMTFEHGDSRAQLVARYTMDDFVTRLH